MATHGPFETDVLPTSAGDLRITFLGHGSLLFAYQGKTIYVDPYGQVADYATLPQADLILVTHEHRDHLDPEVLAQVRGPKTALILTEACARLVEGGTVLRAGDARTVEGIPVEAVPAYNLLHRRPSGEPFHPPGAEAPKGAGLGYIITFGGRRVYVAGDTEDTPEMKALTGIDCAFLPMNLPYTMTPEMVAAAARAFRPRILYPYHYGQTDTSRIVELLKGEPGIEVRIRRLA